MMIDSKMFRKKFEDANLDELFKIRDEIIRFMRDYENHNLPSGDYSFDPNPEVRYIVNIDYLMEIFDLIKIKMDEVNFYKKAGEINTCRLINKMISDLKEEEQHKFFEELRKDDENLYELYIELEKNDKLKYIG